MRTRLAPDYNGHLKPLVLGTIQDGSGQTVVPELNTISINNNGTNFPVANRILTDQDTGKISYEWLESESDALTATFPVNDVRARWRLGKFQPADSDTILHIRMDNVDTPTVYVDNSPYGHTLTAIPGGDPPTQDTAIVKFGAGAMDMDGVDDALDVTDHNAFNFGDDDFTIEMWVYHRGTTQKNLYAHGLGTDSSNQTSLAILNTTNTVAFIVRVGGIDEISLPGTTALTQNTWHHVAVERYGDTWTLYLNGQVEATQTRQYTYPSTWTSAIRIGANIPDTVFANMVVDEYRVSGVSRYREEFTPPLDPFHVDFHERVQFFDVVAVDIATNVTDTDLMRAWPIIDDRRIKEQGRVSSATDGITFRDTDNRHEPSGWWAGSRMRFRSGANAGQWRTIKTFDGIDSEFTVHEAFGATPDVGDQYEIHASYQNMIDLSYDELLRRLLHSFGKDRVSRFLDPEDVREAHIYLSLTNLARSMKLQGNVPEADSAQREFGAAFDRAWKMMEIKVKNATEADSTFDSDSDELHAPLIFWGR